MKTQVIQLDSHDDYISARDKIGWSKSGRILLVFPEKNITLNRELDLMLLKRHCDSLGAQMALVSRDEDIRFRAQKLGIPEFSSINAAYKKHWRNANQQKAKEKFPITSSNSRRENLYTLKSLAHPPTPKVINRLEFRLLFFAIGVASVLAIASILIPGANVILKPISKQQEITIQVSADQKNESVNISGAIPARLIDVTVEGRDQIASTGIVDLPDQLATGVVVFSNLTEQPIIIPIGTVVRTTDDMPIRFETTQEIKLEAGYGITQSVEIQAMKPGIVGNVVEESLTSIEGMLGINLVVTNPKPTSGGSEFTSPAPSSKDEMDLYHNLNAALVDSAVGEVKEQLGEGDILLSDTPINVEVLEKEYDPSEPLPADHLYLTLQLECRFLIARADDLHKLAQLSLDVNLPENYLPVENTLSFIKIDEPQGAENTGYGWQMAASRQIKANILANDAINLILGMRLGEATNRLNQSLPLAVTPQITLNPAWWKRLPILPFRINVIIQ